MKTESTALVTGGSSGIGKAISRELARRGWNLWLVSNQTEALGSTAEEIGKEFGVKCHTTDIDLGREEAADELFAESRQRGLQVDVLVNDAGIFAFCDTTRTAPGKTRLFVRLHVYTVTRLCQTFGQEMQQRGKGYILNLSSLSAWLPFPGIALYAATKAYVRTFSRAFALEMRPSGVRVLCLCPGGIATGLYGLSPRWLKTGVRLGVLMTPERLARKALNRLFRRRGPKPTQYIPGWGNRLLIPLFALMPARLLMYAKRLLHRYEK
ncbi:MAG: SDR family NAD(P)-dependent oxidoreductase [Bacteroidaceae bacterium]|jgi:short-subunit dehydrogenase